MKDVTEDLGNALRTALERANQAIYETARKNHRLMGMGTTVVAAVITDDGVAHVAHVGDSRAYIINEGQAVQVTRDHTMVNLFVDAELLTPEDAATHPEAHVLSRSLGVERQVDVELADPIELADNDTVFLCSDGVHGCLTDYEVGSVDWSAPEHGVNHLLELVDERNGDDNATAVAVLIGEANSMGASPLPEPKPVEDSLASSLLGEGNTIIPDEDDFEVANDPPTYNTEPSVANDDPPTAPSLPSGAGPAVAKGASPAPIQRRRVDNTPEAPSSKKPLILVALALLALGGMGVFGIALMSIPEGSIDDPLLVPPTPTPTPSTNTLAMDGPQPVTEPVPVAEREPVPATPTAPDVVFASKVPDAPRRLPHRARTFNASPPNGNLLFVAVQAARDKKCAESLAAVRHAMTVSPDHAKLYTQSWFCYDQVDSAPLAEIQLKDWDELSVLEEHLRGWPAPGDPAIVWTAEEQRLPEWYRPANGGVEHRLEAWADSTDQDQLRAVMTDLKGEPSVTDALASDLYVEAQLAVALSELPEPTAVQIEAWARRVYVLSSALNGRVGRLLQKHRPELHPSLEAALAQATSTTNDRKLPAEVAQAFEVGRGKAPPPTSQPVKPPPRPSGNPKNDNGRNQGEPDLGGGTMPGVIHR